MCYRVAVKKLLFVCLFIFLGLTTVKAQDFTVSGNFGARLEGIVFAPSSSSPSFLPLIGVHIGIEVGNQEWRGGLRLALASFVIFIDHVSIDAYARYTLASDLGLYFGIGSSWLVTFGPVQPNPNRLNVVFQDWHALVGVQFSNGLFLELTPGFGTYFPPSTSSLPPTVSGFSLAVGMGWNWKF